MEEWETAHRGVCVIQISLDGRLKKNIPGREITVECVHVEA